MFPTPLRARSGARAAAVPLLFVLPTLTGCAATRNAVRYGELERHTSVEPSVFLTPGATPRAVYVEVQNTSGIEAPLADALVPLLEDAGHTLVPEPAGADCVLQVNILQLTRRELDEDDDVRDAVVDAAMAGATVGMLTGIVANAASLADEVTVVAGVGAYLLDARSRRPLYTLVTDLRITEAAAAAGPSAPVVHETRLAVGASKTNLDAEEAVAVLLGDLAKAVAGILPAGVGGAPLSPGRSRPPSARAPGS